MIASSNNVAKKDPRVADAHAALAKLRTGGNTVAPQDAEALLGEAVGPLLEMKGYALERRAAGIDFLARCPPTAELAGLTIGIELKHMRRPMHMEAVRQLIGSAMLKDIDRAVLVSSGGFSQAARQAVERSLPVRIELWATMRSPPGSRPSRQSLARGLIRLASP